MYFGGWGRESADSWYCCTRSSTEALLRSVKKQVFALSYDAQGLPELEGGESDSLGYHPVFCERAPGLLCTAEILTQAPDERFFLLTFRRLYGYRDGCLDADVWEADGSHGLPRASYSALMSGPPAMICVGLLRPPKPMQDQGRQYFASWRKLDKARLKAPRITTDCRHLYINKDDQNPNDLFFQLGVILRQEDKIPDADRAVLDEAFLLYLRTEFKKRCGSDLDLAWRVLCTVLKNFAVPEDWREFRRYIRLTIECLRKNKSKEDTLSEWRRRFLDPDRQVYSPWGAAQELGCSERQVYRDMQEYGLTTYNGFLGITVAQVKSLREHREANAEFLNRIALSAQVRGVDKKTEQRRVQRLRREMSQEQICQKLEQEIRGSGRAKDILVPLRKRNTNTSVPVGPLGREEDKQ